jgi:PRTRC genetic system protein C
MTTQETTYTRRVFRYGDKSFPDPGSGYTPEQILTTLKGYFPELGHAKTEEKLLEDGTLEITFSKQVTRKGAKIPGAVS